MNLSRGIGHRPGRRRRAQPGIYFNLLSNAIKYSYEGGKITVTSGRKGDKVFFSVKDTGIGMSVEDKARLFEDFFRANNELTRKKTGTGLGLAITKNGGSQTLAVSK